MNGRLEVTTLQAKTLEGNPLGDPTERSVLVYLPKGYDEGETRYPTVYFLHAFGGSGQKWLNFSTFTRNVPDVLDGTLTAGEAPPVIGVFVDALSRLGGTQYVNSTAVGRYRDYLVEDIVPFVDGRFRTLPDAASRAVVGHSSGGYGALAMGRHHPDVFGHVASHSGDSGFEYCYLPDFPKAADALLALGGAEAWLADFYRRSAERGMQGRDHPVLNTLAMAAAYSPSGAAPLGFELPFDAATARLRESVWSRWLEHDPARFVPTSLEAFKRLQSVYLDCGLRDEAGLRWGTRMVSEALANGGVEHHHEEFDGGHMGCNWRFAHSLAYLGARLTRAPEE